MQFTTVAGTTLSYQWYCYPHAQQTIVFANSLGTDYRIWQQVIHLLGGQYNVLCYDKAGHGLSSPNPSHSTIDDYAHDLHALLSHLKIERSVICGLSVGGLIAQGVYNKSPHWVDGIILCCTAHKLGTADTWQDRINALEKQGLASMIDGIIQRWFSPTFLEQNAPDCEGCATMLTQMDEASYRQTCQAIAGADFTDTVSQIACPVLCIAGKNDNAVPAQAVQKTAQLINNSTYIEIDECGHIPCMEQPEKLTAIIKDFMNNV